MERIRRHLSFANVAAGLALLFSMTGGAFAATGGFSSGGTLKACANEEGRLKLLKSGEHCRRGQKSISWSQIGPAGAKGATGASGAAGAGGPSGAPGAAGADGSARAYGVTNPAGELVASKSKNLTVRKVPFEEPGGQGVYCVKPTAGSGIDANTVNPVVTPEYNGGNGGFLNLAQSVEATTQDTTDCAGGWTFVTDNYDTSSNKWQRKDAGLTIIVP